MKKILLHSCCAPCLTSVNEQLEGDFSVSSFWDNPCIEPAAEHTLRLTTLQEFCDGNHIDLLVSGSDYSKCNRDFQAMASGLSQEPEGGKRCSNCIRSRLLVTAIYAKENDFPIFGTTLTVSPHKNAVLVNQIGEQIAAETGVEFLAADFKKQGGYQRSVELSKQFKLYRQNYCGCRYSNRDSSSIG